MNHSLQTVNRYYDFNNISDSVVRSLELEKTANENTHQSSQFYETVDGVETEMENTVTSTLPNNNCSSASLTAQRKMNLLGDSSDSKVSNSQVTASSSYEMEDADSTVQKIKQCGIKLSLPFGESNRLKKNN